MLEEITADCALDNLRSYTGGRVTMTPELLIPIPAMRMTPCVIRDRALGETGRAGLACR